MANTRLKLPGVYLEKHDTEWLSNAKIEICSQCKVALLCYANRPLLGYWCEHCVGFYLFDLNMLVQCTEFQRIAHHSVQIIRERLLHEAYKYGHSIHSMELICCTKRRLKQLEVFGGMVIRHTP